jgi:hypothetical protein
MSRQCSDYVRVCTPQDESGGSKDVDALFVHLHEADSSVEKLKPAKCFVLQSDDSKTVCLALPRALLETPLVRCNNCFRMGWPGVCHFQGRLQGWKAG